MVTYQYVKCYDSIFIHLEVININLRNFNFPVVPEICRGHVHVPKKERRIMYNYGLHEKLISIIIKLRKGYSRFNNYGYKLLMKDITVLLY